MGTQAKSEFICVDDKLEFHSKSSNADHNGNLLYRTEAETAGSLPSTYTNNREVSCAVCRQSSTTYKSYYTQWGSNTCASSNGGGMIYKGFLAGTHYTHGGSGHNQLCLHESRHTVQGPVTATT